MQLLRRVVAALKRPRKLVYVFSIALMLAMATKTHAADGTLGTSQIEIDGKATPETQQANLYPYADPQAAGTIKSDVKNKPPANVDWVKDLNANTDSKSLINGVATGIDPVGPLFPNGKRVPTGITNGKGHWNGLRIVDGAGDNDQEIVSFGKFDDAPSWQIQAKNVGGAKYDLTQAYLAASGDVVNSQGVIIGPASIYAGVERSFNNGTFYMGIEFNLMPPVPVGTGSRPNRTNGDMLFLITLQGSSGSATANLEIQEFKDGVFVKKNVTSAMTSINSTATPAAPWGRVDSRGDWVLTDIPAWELAEVAVPLNELSQTLKCAGSAYVQLHSRSSISISSDVKDVTPYFKFEFKPPTAVPPELGTDCDANVTFEGGSNEVGATNEWQFKVTPATVTLTSTSTLTSCGGGCYKTTAPFTGGSVTVNFSNAPGVNSASIEASLTVKVVEGACAPPDSGPKTITVYRPIDCVATLTGSCNLQFSYGSTVIGGSGGTTYAWTFEYSIDGGKTFATAGGSASDATATSGTYTALATQQGLYRAKLFVTDSINCSHLCTSNTIEVRAALTASASKNVPSAPAPGLNADTNFTVTIAGSTNAVSGDTLATKWQKFDGTNWTDFSPAETGPNLTLSLSQMQTLGTTANASFSIGADPYVGKVYTMTVRLHAERTLNGTTCSANSSSVVVKAVKAVDP